MEIDIRDFAPELARRLVEHAINTGSPMLLSGPRGSGKTKLVLSSATALGRPVEVFHCGGATDVEATIFGTVTLRDGETHFQRSRFVSAIQKPFTVVVLDEVNRVGNPRVQGALMSCMDFQARLVLDQEDDPDERVVHVAEGVTFVCTANIGAGYQGTEPLDAAFLDRMLKHGLDYSEREAELLVLHGLGEDVAQRVMALVRSIRSQSRSGALTGSMSTRGLVYVADLLKAGFSMEEAFEAVVGVWDEDSRAALRAALAVTP